MENLENKSTNSKRKMLIALIIVLSILLIGAIVAVWMQIGSAKKTADNSSQSQAVTVSPSGSVSSTTTTTVSQTPSSSISSTAISASADQANNAAMSFMQAKKDRSLGAAKQYMTEQLYNNTDQVEFAGTSSPSMSRFEITSNTVKDPQTWRITVKSYWLLQNEDAGTINYTLEVMKLDNNFLVNKFDQN